MKILLHLLQTLIVCAVAGFVLTVTMMGGWDFLLTSLFHR